MPVPTKYSYTKDVNVARLKQEINGSSIVTMLDNILFSTPALDITFKDAISAADKTTLDGLVTAHVNTPLPDLVQAVDVDGAVMSRKKITDKGDHYQSRFITFTTSKLGSIILEDYDGSALPAEALIKFYDAADVELTLQADLDDKCVRTEVDITMPFDFKIMKGAITIDHETTDRKALLYFRMAPGLGPVYGEKDMIHGLPLRSLQAGNWKMFDGEAPKPIVQANFGGTPNFRKRVWHSPGSQIEIFSEIILFKV